MVGGAGLSMREVWHKGSAINAQFAIVGSQRKEVQGPPANAPAEDRPVQFLWNS